MSDIEEAFKKFSFIEHPFTEEEWEWYLAFHPASLDTFTAGFEAARAKYEYELNQQRFNNKHNLSIDGTIADKIAELEKENEKLRLVILQAAGRLTPYAGTGYVEGIRKELREALKKDECEKRN